RVLGLDHLRYGQRCPAAHPDAGASPGDARARRGPVRAGAGRGQPGGAASLLSGPGPGDSVVRAGSTPGARLQCPGRHTGRSASRAAGAGAEANPAALGRRGSRRRRGRAGRVHRQGREAQGGDGRDPRRDRLGPRGERRGVREELRPEGRAVTSEGPLPPLAAGGPIGADPSFVELVARVRPELIRPLVPPGTAGGVVTPHGTTVLGLKFAGGVVFAGDRRATEGYAIADDRMEKVFAADDLSVIAIAGVAGQAVEIVKLFQLELEHYEKITGDRLSLEGKANRLAQMIRGNFPLAMQGLVVVPLFGGYDER